MGNSFICSSSLFEQIVIFQLNSEKSKNELKNYLKKYHLNNLKLCFKQIINQDKIA